MSRLPPKPDLSWKEDGTPVDERVGDVYFSRQNGLEETRNVFLKGCGLPEGWLGREQFIIAELGFGTGLNFLATWQRWRETRGAAGWLHFVSFEGYPLDREDAARALSAWPELSDISGKLIEAWPDRARSVQTRAWPQEHLSLTLHIGDIADTLPDARFRADAWFLDGFSPARNEAMWAESLWPLVAERSEPGTRAATFTVAGAVRRGLAGVGFAVEKAPGFGHKRERLEARFEGVPQIRADMYGLRTAAKLPAKVRIIGAGIAGACAARHLMDRGIEVEVFDRAGRAACGASGNPLALVMPRLDAGDTDQARLLVDAYLAARHFYAGRPGVSETDVFQRPRDEGDAGKIAKTLADPPLGLENLEALPGGGQLHKRALIIRPGSLIPALLDGVDLKLGRDIMPADLDDGVPTILAAGHAIGALLPWLRVEGRLGQVEHCIASVEAPASAIASGDYALATGRDRLWGATFEAWDGGGVETREGARLENLAALQRLDPWWRQDALQNNPESRAGVRATTPDRLPLIGAVPDHDVARRTFAALRHGRAVDADAPLAGNLYMAGGFGARGFTWAPWAGNVLAAQLLGEPAPASECALRTVSPMRQILRDLKRGG